jgi:hypothetical protein
MLQTHGADIRALTNLGANALILAAQWGHLDLVTWPAGQGKTLIWAEYNEWAQKLLHNNISV